MDAIDERRPALFEAFGSGDIGLDHELLDELVSIEALGRHYPLDQAVGVEDELALGEIKLERRAPHAAFAQDMVGRPQGPKDGL